MYQKLHIKSYVVGTHENRLVEMILISTTTWVFDKN